MAIMTFRLLWEGASSGYVGTLNPPHHKTHTHITRAESNAVPGGLRGGVGMYILNYNTQVSNCLTRDGRKGGFRMVKSGHQG